MKIVQSKKNLFYPKKFIYLLFFHWHHHILFIYLEIIKHINTKKIYINKKDEITFFKFSYY